MARNQSRIWRRKPPERVPNLPPWPLLQLARPAWPVRRVQWPPVCEIRECDG